jgi:hypothetical protein
MSRITRRAFTVLATTASLAAFVSASAQAKVFHVTGQQTKITPSAQVVTFLTAHSITVTPVAPATASGGSLTLPISGGFVVTPHVTGTLRHEGGIEFSKGSHTLVLRHFVLRVGRHRGFLTARTGHRTFTLAKLVGITRSVSGKSGTLSGELKLSRAAAEVINHRFGKHLVSKGTDLGSLTSTVTVA